MIYFHGYETLLFRNFHKKLLENLNFAKLLWKKTAPSVISPVVAIDVHNRREAPLLLRGQYHLSY